MRIAFFLPSLALGGVEVVTLKLVAALAQRSEDQIDLVLSRASGEFLSRVPGNVTVYDLKGRSTFLSAQRLCAYFGERKPDVAIPAQTPAVVTCLLARGLSRHKPCVIPAIHGIVSESSSAPQGVRKQVMFALLRRLLATSDHIIAVSQCVKSDLTVTCGIPERQCTVVYNPIIDDAMLATRAEDAAHPYFDSGQPVIVSVGRLSKEKNLAGLLRAFEIVSGRTDARLLIVGDGPEKESLIRQVGEMGLSERVDLMGYVSNPLPYIARSQVLALPSDYEALPTVLIEAVAAGTYVVATDCGGTSEIISKPSYGCLVRTGDMDGFAKELLHAMSCGISAVCDQDFIGKFGTADAVGRYRELALAAVRRRA